MTSQFILPRRRRRVRPYLDFTAMIDTVFNLLIFFAVISTFVGAGTQKGIAMQLPSAKTSQPVKDRVVLSLTPGARPQVNGLEVEVAQIGATLREVTKSNYETQIVVMADKKVQYSDLVAALDKTREAGFSKIALATAPNPEKEPGAAGD
jgi:biopolymer transport protein ExbD